MKTRITDVKQFDRIAISYLPSGYTIVEKIIHDGDSIFVRSPLGIAIEFHVDDYVDVILSN